MKDLTVASTTDDQTAVNAAAGVFGEDAEPQEELNDNPQPEAAAKEGETKSTSEDSEVPPPAEPPAARPPMYGKRSEKRINQLLRERGELQNRLEELERRVAGFPPPSTATPPAPPAAATQIAAKRPEPSQFKTYEEYVEALTDWKVEEHDRQREVKAQQEALAERQKAIFDAHMQRWNEARNNYDDWIETVEQSPISVPQAAQVGIIESDVGPDVTYYLATHPQVAKELWEMTDSQVIATIGRLSAQIEGANRETHETPQPELVGNATRRTVGADLRPTTNARPPVRGLTGNRTSSTVSLDSMDYQDFARIRRQQEKERYRR